MIDSLLKLRTSAKLLLNPSYNVTRDSVRLMICCTTCKLFLIIFVSLKLDLKKGKKQLRLKLIDVDETDH